MPPEPALSLAGNAAETEVTTTQRRIILAAERLFAERGIDAVSLRSIMAAAGTNVASVHYHFGSKQALVDTLIRERSGEVAARRAEFLDLMEHSAQLTPRQLAEAFVRPVAEMAEGPGNTWVRFIAGIIGSTHPSLATVIEGFTQQAVRFIRLLEKIDPAASPDTVRFRLTQAMLLTFRVLGNLDASKDALAISGADLQHDHVLAQLLDVVTSILAGPPDR